MLHDTVQFATEAANNGGLDFLYVLIPALFGGYGISTIISHFTKRSSEKDTQKLEGTRLGQDIMEKAMLRLDKEVTDLRKRDLVRDAEYTKYLNTNNALIRYLTKLINHIKQSGGNVPLVDTEDEPYLEELSKFAKADNS